MLPFAFALQKQAVGAWLSAMSTPVSSGQGVKVLLLQTANITSTGAWTCGSNVYMPPRIRNIFYCEPNNTAVRVVRLERLFSGFQFQIWTEVQVYTGGTWDEAVCNTM